MSHTGFRAGLVLGETLRRKPRSADALRRRASTMIPAVHTFPAADAEPESDPHRAVLLLFTNAPPATGAGGTADPHLPSASRLRPTVRP